MREAIHSEYPFNICLAEFLHLLEEETTLPSSNRLETKSTPMILDAPEILAPSAACDLIKEQELILYFHHLHKNYNAQTQRQD